MSLKYTHAPASVVVVLVVIVNNFYIFSFDTAWPIKAKFHVASSWEAGTEVCINGQGHMTKMADMPIYGKNLLLQNRKSYG